MAAAGGVLQCEDIKKNESASQRTHAPNQDMCSIKERL